ncbi:MAG: hypothetical protein KDE22_12045, partial [Rhodobacterales bacterium]|nr:hypothetical protein [Rhodobacterales bacterium]
GGKGGGCLGLGGVADGEGLIASVWELGSSEVPKSRAVPGNIGEGTFVYVKGRPATFATSGELPWKRTLAESLGNVMLEGTGLVLRFTRQTTSKPQFRGDIDNLCEPVFSVVINKLGWLGGRRPNMRFWIASVKSGSQEGVELAAFKEVPEQEWCNSESLVFEGEYFGEIPKDGRNEEFPGWIREKWNNQPLRKGESLGVHLQFNSNDINIGGVSTGCVKSILDCTYPIIGGYAGAPDDWKIRKIIVEKDTPMNGVVKIYIYNIGLEEIFFGGSVLRPYSNLRCP